MWATNIIEECEQNNITFNAVGTSKKKSRKKYINPEIYFLYEPPQHNIIISLGYEGTQ